MRPLLAHRIETHGLSSGGTGLDPDDDGAGPLQAAGVMVESLVRRPPVVLARPKRLNPR